MCEARLTCKVHRNCNWTLTRSSPSSAGRCGRLGTLSRASLSLAMWKGPRLSLEACTSTAS
eukprot:4751629-Alexandrium_andersonii.AAC.1